jgi:hypothetical protein
MDCPAADAGFGRKRIDVENRDFIHDTKYNTNQDIKQGLSEDAISALGISLAGLFSSN